jgi:hypothetical protein
LLKWDYFIEFKLLITVVIHTFYILIYFILFILFKTVQEKIDQIAEMTEVMKQAVELDENSANNYEERIKMLEIENQGLKELLKIKTTYGVKDDDDE